MDVPVKIAEELVSQLKEHGYIKQRGKKRYKILR